MKRFRPLIIIATVICITPVLKVAAQLTHLPVLLITQGQPQTPDFMPRRSLTPGDKLSVTETEVCAPGYGVKALDVPISYKNKVFKAYGKTSSPSYIIDRLISIDLGGSSTIRNLWPQPRTGDWNSQKKDQLERELRRRVCNGSLKLATAQQEIAENWVAAYSKYLDSKSKPKAR